VRGGDALDLGKRLGRKFCCGRGQFGVVVGCTM
jgi:hypothetical protein